MGGGSQRGKHNLNNKGFFFKWQLKIEIRKGEAIENNFTPPIYPTQLKYSYQLSILERYRLLH